MSSEQLSNNLHILLTSFGKYYVVCQLSVRERRGVFVVAYARNESANALHRPYDDDPAAHVGHMTIKSEKLRKQALNVNTEVKYR